MKPSRSIFAIALMLLVLPALVAAQESERVHKVVPLGPGGTVSLHNFSGAVRVVGADVNEVTIDAVRTAPRDRLDHIKLDVGTSGSTVTIQANKKDPDWHVTNDNVVKTEMDITMPRHARLEIKVFSSDVHVRNVVGDQKLETFSGDLRVEEGPARIDAKTFSGDIEAGLMAGATGPDLGLETFSGSITLRVPGNAAAALDFDSFSGKLTSEVPLTVAEQRKGHLRATLNGGDAQHRVHLKTFSGDVKIGR
jgi:DUF4097 and DUF4098 domain-containing protein YvlB